MFGSVRSLSFLSIAVIFEALQQDCCLQGDAPRLRIDECLKMPRCRAPHVFGRVPQMP